MFDFESSNSNRVREGSLLECVHLSPAFSLHDRSSTQHHWSSNRAGGSGDSIGMRMAPLLQSLSLTRRMDGGGAERSVGERSEKLRHGGQCQQR